MPRCCVPALPRRGSHRLPGPQGSAIGTAPLGPPDLADLRERLRSVEQTHGARPSSSITLPGFVIRARKRALRPDRLLIPL